MINNEDEWEMIELVCPISLEVMKDPVITPDGHTFDRAPLEQWLSTHSTNPLTNRTLNSNSLIPNRAIKSIICSHPQVVSTQPKQLPQFGLTTLHTHAHMIHPYRGKQQTKQKVGYKTVPSLRKSIIMDDPSLQYTSQKQQLQYAMLMYERWEMSFRQLAPLERMKVNGLGEFAGKWYEYGTGEGTISYLDGTVYEGWWANKLPNGFGRKRDREEHLLYCGSWKNGSLHGWGWVIQEKKREIVFAGHWQNGVKSGYGMEFVGETKCTEQGFWRKGYKHGEFLQTNHQGQSKSLIFIMGEQRKQKYWKK